jgi:hypothetical protein
MNNYVGQNQLISEDKKMKAFEDKNLNAKKVVIGSQT